MISWLKGQIIKNWHLPSKNGVVLNVGGIGYEIQLLSKQLSLTDTIQENEFWIHQINREDYSNLYGFKDAKQRDLFRIIISVNGIGPQIGMALLEDFEVNHFIEVIETNDLYQLTKSQGIGKRIAERLVVELKNKLQQFKDSQGTTINRIKPENTNKFTMYIEEIKSILNSLGYIDNEIKDAIELITTKQQEITLALDSLSTEAKSDLMDKHLKEILIRLSQKST